MAFSRDGLGASEEFTLNMGFNGNNKLMLKIHRNFIRFSKKVLVLQIKAFTNFKPTFHFHTP